MTIYEMVNKSRDTGGNEMVEGEFHGMPLREAFRQITHAAGGNQWGQIAAGVEPEYEEWIAFSHDPYDPWRIKIRLNEN